MSQSKSNQNEKITITVPREFYRILKEIAKAYYNSVEEYVIDQLVCGLDCDLQSTAGVLLGFDREIDYQDQLRAMVSGRTA